MVCYYLHRFPVCAEMQQTGSSLHWLELNKLFCFLFLVTFCLKTMIKVHSIFWNLHISKNSEVLVKMEGQRLQRLLEEYWEIQPLILFCRTGSCFTGLRDCLPDNVWIFRDWLLQIISVIFFFMFVCLLGSLLNDHMILKINKALGARWFWV